MARATASRGCELVDEALAVGAVQRRALAPDGLGDQEALLARQADHRGRVKLGELEVGEHRARLAGEQQAGAERAGRVGRPRPEGGGTARGEDHGAGGEVAAVLEPYAAVRGRIAAARRPSSTVDAVVLDDPRRRASAGCGGRSRCRPRG